jgi:hypothetical protein
MRCIGRGPASLLVPTRNGSATQLGGDIWYRLARFVARSVPDGAVQEHGSEGSFGSPTSPASHQPAGL